MPLGTAPCPATKRTSPKPWGEPQLALKVEEEWAPRMSRRRTNKKSRRHSWLMNTLSHVLSTFNTSLHLKGEIQAQQWCTPALPATQEAEAKGSFEPRSSRPAWATWPDSISKRTKGNYKFKISQQKWTKRRKRNPWEARNQELI